MKRTLVRSIEFTMTGETRVYDLYQGDFICVVGSSANGYWRDRSDGIRHGESITKEARIMVLSDGGYIGHWNTEDEVREFITYYLRGEIQTEVSS